MPRKTADAEGPRSQLAAFMQDRGLRVTGQRNVIVEAFLRSRAHIGVEQLLEQVRRRHPRIGYATVYRTLKMLVESGIATERRFDDGITRYELVRGTSHHDHLICLSCGRIVEWSDPAVEEAQDRIAKKHGFSLRAHKHELYGLCEACHPPEPPHPPPEALAASSPPADAASTETPPGRHAE